MYIFCDIYRLTSDVFAYFTCTAHATDNKLSAALGKKLSANC